MAANVDAWVPYFQNLTAVAAALLAIAFLTFQFRSDIWRTHPLKQTVAITTLGELAAPMFLGILFLMPGHPWVLGGRLVGVGGYLIMAWHVAVFIRYRRLADRFDKWQLCGVAITVVTFSFLLWWDSLDVKAYTAAWMIFSGFSEAWVFLVPHKPAVDAS
ncbi:hypothetical protein [Planosporangium mesophilum]|uniref:Uncharacterized protein n=1 Tax=Planosporangium mesophilum TaxID=689768 RepID=A0A8J3TDD8_9ACTN|nr:hypothetical protein [Planosporangium mesophilum]NJC82726.1 hypothetical protein [Planosporangium mesophilum]GII23807.1 hypothetical protein Pme01_34040 [Planosporangium mesophilum]